MTATGEGLGALADRLIPGPGGALDVASRNLQAGVARIRSTGLGRAVATAPRGNDWLGHPAHPIVVAVPIGAWVVSSIYDLKSAAGTLQRNEDVADGALRVGIVAAL